MRADEDGVICPSTLGEYRDMCETLGGPDCEAVRFLDARIVNAIDGKNEKVLKADSQMRILLMPMLGIA